MAEWCGEDMLKSLEGRVLCGAAVSLGERFIKFDTDEGPLVYEAVGDCCSYSWFAALKKSPVGAVRAATELEISESEEECKELPPQYFGPGPYGTHTHDDCCYLKKYTVRLATSAGEFDVVFWNDSNGYYGGFLVRATLEQWWADNKPKEGKE